MKPEGFHYRFPQNSNWYSQVDKNELNWTELYWTSSEENLSPTEMIKRLAAGQNILTAGQFTGCPAFNETLM